MVGNRYRLTQSGFLLNMVISPREHPHACLVVSTLGSRIPKSLVVHSVARYSKTLYLKDGHSTTESNIPMLVKWWLRLSVEVLPGGAYTARRHAYPLLLRSIVAPSVHTGQERYCSAQTTRDVRVLLDPVIQGLDSRLPLPVLLLREFVL